MRRSWRWLVRRLVIEYGWRWRIGASPAADSTRRNVAMHEAMFPSSTTAPGHSSQFTFKALNPGLYVIAGNAAARWMVNYVVDQSDFDTLNGMGHSVSCTV